MKIKKDILLAALEQPTRITQGKITQGVRRLLITEGPQFGKGMQFEASDGNQACLERFDSDGSIQPACVQASNLQTAVAFGGDEIELTVESSSLLRYESNGRSMALSVFNPDEFSSIKPDGQRLGLPTHLIADGIESVARFVSVGEGRIELEGVRVVTTADRITCEGANGRQYSVYSTSAVGVDCEFILPSQFISAFVKALRRPDSALRVSDSLLVVEHRDGHYLCKQGEGRFPKLASVIRGGASVGHIAHDEWLEVFKCIKSLGAAKGGDIMSVRLKFTDKDCLVSSAGHTTFEQSIIGNFTPGKIIVSADSFFNCLSAFDDESTIRMSCLGEREAVILNDGDLMVATTQIRDCNWDDKPPLTTRNGSNE